MPGTALSKCEEEPQHPSPELQYSGDGEPGSILCSGENSQDCSNPFLYKNLVFNDFFCRIVFHSFKRDGLN